MSNFFTRTSRQIFGTLACLTVASCSTVPTNDGIEPLSVSEALKPSVELQERNRGDGAGSFDGAEEATPKPVQTGILSRSRVPSLASDGQPSDDADTANAPNFGIEEVDAFVPSLPIPEFIAVVFGEQLKVPYTTGPNIQGRTEVIQLRSSGRMDAATFLDLVSTALEDYGVRVAVGDGVYRIVEEQQLRAGMPRFVISRARQSAPASIRPIVQFVPLQALDANQMVSILRQAFGDRANNLSIDANPGRGYVILNGLPDDVNAAVDVIAQMDELQYAGTDVIKYRPRFWPVETMATDLNELLNAEGWLATTTYNAPRTILVLPIAQSNTLFIFTRSTDAARRVRHWLAELDQPAVSGDTPQLFVYNVQRVDATTLAQTVNLVAQPSANGGFGVGGTPAPTTATGGGDNGGDSGGGATVAGNFVVDPLGNRLIFSGTASEFERVLPLLRQLDQAPAEVLIEVTVAEVTLGDSDGFGVEWAIENLGGEDVSAFVAQQGIGLGSGGFDFGVFTNDVNVQLNAFANNSRVNVLSRPRLVAQSGGSSQIQVGADVPIIASQSAGPQDGVGAGLDILQTVQYRSTGVLLSIEPIVFSDNRIELSVSQEVSTALPTTAAAISSPTISNRSVTTSLSLEDGATAVIGGLIQENITYDDNGIPLLKDLPGIGNVFSTKSRSVDRTELVVLITAYVIRSTDDMAQFVDVYTREISQNW